MNAIVIAKFDIHTIIVEKLGQRVNNDSIRRGRHGFDGWLASYSACRGVSGLVTLLAKT